MTFKPKKQQIHVPGYGVVQKEDFNQDHYQVLMKRAGMTNRDTFIKQHLEVESYGDQPLFVGAPAPVEKPKGGRGGKGKSQEAPTPLPPPAAPAPGEGNNASEQPGTDDDAELKRLIAEEEAAKVKETDSAAE